ncbi:amidohydrolase [Achromobacter sp. GG226]|uniref:M20 aminoacylase family protein n=1 Tax=Verticiella alkaliphila TaxID=2779529 RepID=UPI001C0BFF09|nr:M20 aminoacylase family protein [Verticiella sp. GG226]MBU4612364.1 amidohydrolase [Verticiella sp. GG226]
MTTSTPTSAILGAIAADPRFVEIRRDIHAHPEIAFEEHRTAARVAEELRAWGWTVTTGIGGTGVVGTLSKGAGTRSIGLRADMDALAMDEVNTFAHRSRHAGRMHACGHDGHTAILLAAAWYLSHHAEFDGTIHCIFQPAEEGGQAGARAMIEDGLFTRFPCDAVFGLHNWPDLPAGEFGVRAGPFMGSSNRFRIDVTGKGAHASQPELSIDPLVCASHILLALQSVISRNREPQDAAVLSVTQIHGGAAVNVIPEQAWLGGTVRTHEAGTLDMIERRMNEIVAGAGATFGCEATLTFERCYPCLVNDPGQTAFALDVLRDTVGEARVHGNIARLMGSEDFSFMLEARPGCYVMLGIGDGTHRASGHGAGPCLLHNPSYDFNDAVIPDGAAYFVQLAQRFLAQP